VESPPISFKKKGERPNERSQINYFYFKKGRREAEKEA
jgi:hypothetical protein